MSPLSFILILASFLFLFFAVDGMQRRKFSFLHFFVFFGGSALILAFIFIPGFQEWFSRIIGVARGSDVIVYGALMTLGYFYFELLNAVTKDKNQTTKIITAEAIRNRTSYGSIDSTTASQKDNYVFLIRAYNEATALWKVVDTIIKAGFKKIIIVNDGSQDDTFEVASTKWREYEDKAYITVISHLINRWWWAANKTWFAFARQYMEKMKATWMVTYDADGQMIIDDMNTFMQEITNPVNHNIKAYLGSRFAHWGEAHNMPKLRKLILWWSKIITLVFNRLNVSDPHNWYRVLHKDALSNIHLTSDGMMYASELLDSIRLQEIAFKEVPVRIEYTEYSLGKWQKNRNALKILWELIYKKIFYK